MAKPYLVPAPEPERGLLARSDDELMTLARTGSRDSFSTLVRRHAERVATCCVALVGNRDQGIELAQDAWVSVWEQRERYTPGSDFVPWLLTIARNRCRNHLRHRKVVLLHAAQSAAVGAESTPEQIDQLIVQEHRRHVRAALERLSPALRDALLLRFAEGLRYDEIAKLLATNEATLRSRVHYGLKSLKEYLGRNS
ncbi:MAG TPA: RNA polymerase sigma factor [Polyangiaceae bacterium]|nr:RNA polymerase sigma factor [Polyangiaceae bacterium]